MDANGADPRVLELQRWLLQVMEEQQKASETLITQQHLQLRLALEARTEEMLALLKNDLLRGANAWKTTRQSELPGAEQAPMNSQSKLLGTEQVPTNSQSQLPGAEQAPTSSQSQLLGSAEAQPVENAIPSGAATFVEAPVAPVEQPLKAEEVPPQGLSKKARKFSHHLTEEEDIKEANSLLAWFMDKPLDTLAGLLIFASTVCIFAKLQWRGQLCRAALYPAEDASRWQGAGQIFDSLEYFFTIVFFIELMLRLGYFKMAFFKDGLNILDASVVLLAVADTFILSWLGIDGGGLVVTRLIRYAKLVRTLRFMRVMGSCHDLRVLMRTIVSSFMALFWSMLVLLGFMLMASIFLCQTLQEFIMDPTQNTEHRIWVESHYGSATTALWTMFEITFSGGWPQWVTPLLGYVSAWYALFFTIYVGGVVFGVIRIITALFLKDTLANAANDLNMMMQTKMKEKASFASKLKNLFHKADISKDGMITWDEFIELTNDAEARAYMDALELQVHEVQSMFVLLDDGDGRISFDEFLAGAIRLKGQARSQDVLCLKHDNSIMRQNLETIKDELLELRSQANFPGGAVEPTSSNLDLAAI